MDNILSKIEQKHYLIVFPVPKVFTVNQLQLTCILKSCHVLQVSIVQDQYTIQLWRSTIAQLDFTVRLVQMYLCLAKSEATAQLLNYRNRLQLVRLDISVS